MMLSRTGWDRNRPLGRGQTIEGRRATWGCAAGAPHRGTASPPPPPPPPEWGNKGVHRSAHHVACPNPPSHLVEEKGLPFGC